MSSNSTICILVEKIENLIQRKRKLTPDEMEDLNLSMFDFKYLMSNEQYINNNIYSYNNYRSKIQALKKKLTSYETIKEQYPDYTFYIFFQNARVKIRKGSKTSYGDWATKAGFEWSDLRDGLPEKWLK